MVNFLTNLHSTLSSFFFFWLGYTVQYTVQLRLFGNIASWNIYFGRMLLYCSKASQVLKARFSFERKCFGNNAFLKKFTVSTFHTAPILRSRLFYLHITQCNKLKYLQIIQTNKLHYLHTIQVSRLLTKIYNLIKLIDLVCRASLISDWFCSCQVKSVTLTRWKQLFSILKSSRYSDNCLEHILSQSDFFSPLGVSQRRNKLWLSNFETLKKKLFTRIMGKSNKRKGKVPKGEGEAENYSVLFLKRAYGRFQ